MYYATILFAAEPRYWFMDGWGHRLMKACYDDVDKSWLPVLQWPLSFLDTDATFSLFANMRRLPGVFEQDHASLTLPYANQPTRTVSFCQYSESSSRPPGETSISASSNGPRPHLTAQTTPSYPPEMTSASYLPPASEAVQNQYRYNNYGDHTSEQLLEHKQEQDAETTQHLWKREGT